MLIIDEVQSGFGRTAGSGFFAIQDAGVRPDILVIAKVCAVDVSILIANLYPSGSRKRLPSQRYCNSKAMDRQATPRFNGQWIPNLHRIRVTLLK